MMSYYYNFYIYSYSNWNTIIKHIQYQASNDTMNIEHRTTYSKHLFSTQYINNRNINIIII